MNEDQLKQKEQEELKALLDAPEDGEDASGKNDEQQKKEDKKPPTPDGKNTDKSKSGTDNGEHKDENLNNNSPQPEDKKGQERWHGKSREEVIKEYEALETRITTLENKNPENDKNKPEDKGAKGEDEEANLPTAEELQKMTPTDFAKWVLSRIDEGVKRTIETQEKIRDSVRQEIAEAKKEHPLHEPDYRKMVQAIMDAASAKGTIIPLKEACEQVDAFLGKNKPKSETEDNSGSEELSDEEKSRLKKAKAQVESGAGAPTQPDGSDAETKRIQKALAGSGSKSPLGGLGI